ncbi:MAG TPA: ABC transporter ATP-binding protein [Thermoleophilaceae bacterium]|nr:ABC transporter ATP-binding protein [Thermoleophilaceae bacterium]
MPEEALLEAQALERRYGERTALADVSFTLQPGQTLGLFGANGAGKSTLLRILATLLRPHGGTVRVLGGALPDEAWKVRGRVGYVGHEPLLYRELSGRENLLFHARLHRAPESRVDELIAAVGMQRRSADPVRELSRGMVQRLSAARALLHDPPLLLLDEPYSGLDPAARELLDPLIGKPSGRTRVLVSHDLEAGAAECDVALGLRAGRQMYLGNPDPSALRSLYE